jgi:DnaK suppressor protein
MPPRKPTKSKSKTTTKKPILKIVKKRAAPKPVAKKIMRPKPTVTRANANASSGPIGFKPYKLRKDEEFMNAEQQEHFRNILNLWKQQLLDEFNRMKQHMQNDAANFPDPLDRAAQEEEFNFELRARDRERKLVKKIEEALESLDTQDYGYCVDCGAEIGIRRLEARPTATQCIDCKTFEEIREKQVGG